MAYVGGALKRFPDLHVNIEDLIAEGDKVVVRNTWTATDSQNGRRILRMETHQTASGIGVDREVRSIQRIHCRFPRAMRFLRRHWLAKPESSSDERSRA